jgi:16S rRNA U1498 N3-methylase RsmE
LASIQTHKAQYRMTLEIYDADRLDQTALRILDIAAAFRHMAAVLRAEPDLEFSMHDKKAAEWLANLERWAADSQAKMEVAQIRRRGALRAEAFSAKK